ncbi:hypothetical protein CSKR_106451 [Clonorchis sinensis]|uniref:Uncharacterized protein n=1 Tax=Clonorchis sinensis TaxID=79923 RepID=A0A419PJB0_CLOSI|nr:hypothetical protein CSKR_106451 [Clonorchis sinensis]
MAQVLATWHYPTPVLPSGGMAARHRKGVTAERLLLLLFPNDWTSSGLTSPTLTWPWRAGNVKRPSLFDRRCLRSIARVWWEHRISNAEVRRMVFGRNKSPTIDELITLHRLRWLGRELRMPLDRLPRRVLFAQPREGWRWSNTNLVAKYESH